MYLIWNRIKPNIKKRDTQIFKATKLNITTEANLKIVDFLNITMT